MKAILEFDLPQDQAAYDVANLAGPMVSLLYEVAGQLRSQLKHGAAEKDRSVLESVLTQIYAVLDKLEN